MVDIQCEKAFVPLCPKCNSEYVNRVRRPPWMKLFSSKRRFICSDCGKYFYAAGNKQGPSSRIESVKDHDACFSFFRAGKIKLPPPAESSGS